MTHSSPVPAGATRRTVVAAAGASGLAVLLAACGDSDDGHKSGAPGAGESGGLARTSDIPEGGGKVFADRKVVVTQPAKGEFKAFSAVCTHQGCLVNKVAEGTIDCPCHGSKFSVADGSVRNGPATKPLPPVRVSVKGDSLTLE
ncbi:Rieske (2Fe-2S) protein [Streptomyces cinnamoneus]|uniref:Cytochrome bc1 complex Rieske iron-sulfur subunit n=1 Tax=Streptomyces cinnamoneus TaxID=53446 RepID=A0A2G1XM98_STRCJ|nr:Rieske (2Fe-2S) protein [Streptomyces cinnamoneus]PHQ52259.1 Rieske (2Fe-2S) protein [Streptomyces cinnamoneus]PPT12191.1 Rieske (2Fe-2S) protein [Streptomyces cinnamoneus]